MDDAGQHARDVKVNEYDDIFVVSGRGKLDSAQVAITDSNTGSSMYIWAFDKNGLPLTSFGGGTVTSIGTAGSGESDFGGGIAVDSSGRVVVAGYSFNTAGNSDMVVWRYLPNGTLDLSFNGTGYVIKDGIAGSGSFDFANDVAIDNNGNIVVAGGSVLSGGTPIMAVWRLLPGNGADDNSFNNTGLFTWTGGTYAMANSLTITSNNSVLVTGEGYNGTQSNMTTWRIDNNGNLDLSFNGVGFVSYADASLNWSGCSVIVDDCDRVLVSAGSYAPGYNSSAFDPALIRYNYNGTPDNSFNGLSNVYNTNFNGYGGYKIKYNNDGMLNMAGHYVLTSNYSVAQFNDACHCHPIATMTFTPIPTFTPVATVCSIVYVSDQVNNRIQIFNMTGTLLDTWGTAGSGDGQLSGPQGIAVDGSGNVFVADYGNTRIEEFDKCGTYLRKWSTSSAPRYVATDASGNVYVTCSGVDTIAVYDSAGNAKATIGTGTGSLDGELSNPLGIDIDNNGILYAVDNYNFRVEKFNTSTGLYTGKWSGSTTATLSAYGITTTDDGNIFIPYTDGTLNKFNNSGSLLGTWSIGNTYLSAASDSNNYIYMANIGTGLILVYNNAGTLLTQWTANSGGTYGIAVANCSQACGSYSTLSITKTTKVLEELSEKTFYNFPNPFKEKTMMRFPMTEKQSVRIQIYDINGKYVWGREIKEMDISIGINYLEWNGKNEVGKQVGNGVYIVKLLTKGHDITKKIVFIR